MSRARYLLRLLRNELNELESRVKLIRGYPSSSWDSLNSFTLRGTYNYMRFVCTYFRWSNLATQLSYQSVPGKELIRKGSRKIARLIRASVRGEFMAPYHSLLVLVLYIRFFIFRFELNNWFFPELVSFIVALLSLSRSFSLFLFALYFSISFPLFSLHLFIFIFPVLLHCHGKRRASAYFIQSINSQRGNCRLVIFRHSRLLLRDERLLLL